MRGRYSIVGLGMVFCVTLGIAAGAAGAIPVSQTTYVAGAGGFDVAAASDSNNCSSESTPCATLVAALAQAGPGGTVYVSGTLSEAVATTVQQDVTIAAAPGATSAQLDGTTADANGLLIVNSGTVSVKGLTFENGRSPAGGAIFNSTSLTVTDCTFSNNAAISTSGSGDGGAITNGDHLSGGHATLVVKGSSFSGNSASNANGGGDGGAIDNGDSSSAGTFTVSVSDSTFSDNSATSASYYGDGGAIDNGDSAGSNATDTLTVSDSTFVGDTAGATGGAIDNGNAAANTATATAAVTGSTFDHNRAFGNGADGGAIDNADTGGVGSISVTGSTFVGNFGYVDGGAIDTADGSAATATIVDSTLTGNSAGSDGGAVDTSDYTGSGTTTIIESTLSGNSAGHNGPTIDNNDPVATGKGTGTLYLAADVIDGVCNQGGGTWTDAGYNAATDASCLGSPAAATDAPVSGAVGNLGSLTDNGGPTSTIALGPGNPALGLISQNSTITPPGGGSEMTLCPVSADQRGSGFGSAASQPCDAGAVQLQTESVSFSSAAPASAVVGGPTYRPSASSSAGLPVSLSIDQATTHSACSLSSGVVSFDHAGSCVVDASAGDANFTRAQAQQTIAVAAASTQTSLTVAAGSLTATVKAVAPGSGTPAGTVAFTSGGQTIGTANLVGGAATLSYSVAANTTETITATYQASDDYTGSSASATASGPVVAASRAVIVNPAITALITSSKRRNPAGWWHTAVTVAFTCNAGGSTIEGGCPDPITLGKSARNETVSRTITTAAGDSSSITLLGIRIDLTRPAVGILGIRNHGRYKGRAPRARCRASDRISGIRSCELRRRVKRTSTGETITFIAKATSWAGTTRMVKKTISVRS